MITLFSTKGVDVVPRSIHGFANTERLGSKVGILATTDLSTADHTAPSTPPGSSFTAPSVMKPTQPNTEMSTQSDGCPRETADLGVSRSVTTKYDSMSTNGYTEEPHRVSTTGGALPSDSTGDPTSESQVMSMTIRTISEGIYTEGRSHKRTPQVDSLT